MDLPLGKEVAQLMSAMRFRNWHHVMLAAGCALVLSLLVSSHWQYAVSMDAISGIKSRRDRMDRLDALLISLLDAETGVRGFLVTGKDAYLEPYRASIPEIQSLIATIRKDAADGTYPTEFVTGLEQKVTTKLEVLATAVVERGVRIGSNESQGPGKSVMDDIRYLMLQMKQKGASDADSLLADSIKAIKLTRWSTIALGVGAMVLLIIVFSLVLRQFRLRAEIAELLHGDNQRLEAEVSRRTADLTAMATYLSSVREQEKGRLARELHDEMGAILTSAKMDASWIARKIDPQAMAQIRERFDRLVTQLNHGITLKRRIIDNLRPPLLEELGLTASLQAMVDEFRASTGLVVVFDGPEDADLGISGDRALALFRIAQESMTNVRKYAQARSVRITLSRGHRNVRLEVSDDGCGFDDTAVAGTHGIAGMRYRVQMFRGCFVVNAAPGEGTRIVAEIPIA